MNKAFHDEDVILKIYITCDLKTRAVRYINRCGDNVTGEDLIELALRSESDFGMFKGYFEEVDLEYRNDGTSSVESIAENILKIAESIFCDLHY